MKMNLIAVFVFLVNPLFAQPIQSNKEFKNRSKVFSINGKPMSFYLKHSKIDSFSKHFFLGDLSLSIDSIPKSFMDSLLTSNSETRPFYFFVFNQIVNNSEGKIVGTVANKCLQYVEKYPCNFFGSFNQEGIDINVVKWTTYIGQALENKVAYFDFRNSVSSSLKEGCSDVQDLWKSFSTEVRMCLIK